MQLRHLRYFVRIVEAGSFSRAATLIHVAQPALSQQIAELGEKLGLSLLQRSARGVRPTVAGEVLYREASSILRQMEQLPGIVRSSSGEAVGTVGLGMSSTLAASLAGQIVDVCRAGLPKVTTATERSGPTRQGCRCSGGGACRRVFRLPRGGILVARAGLRDALQAVVDASNLPFSTMMMAACRATGAAPGALARNTPYHGGLPGGGWK